MRLYLLFYLLFCSQLLVSASVASPATVENFAKAGASIEGLWATEGEEAIVEIYACDEGSFCGRFYWLKDEDNMNPSHDDHNPDEDKRKRLLCGLKFLGGFEAQGEGDYGRGWVYSPRHGARFSASLRLLNANELELRGYLFVPFLGESQTWTRKMNAHACPFIKKKN